jgi:hypothetical protein
MKNATPSPKSESDWARIESLKEADIHVDDEAPAWTPEMFARAVVRAPGQRPGASDSGKLAAGRCSSHQTC